VTFFQLLILNIFHRSWFLPRPPQVVPSFLQRCCCWSTETMSLLKSAVQEGLNHQNPLHRRLLRRKSPSQVVLDTQNGKKTLRAVIRPFLQFSREFIKLSQRSQISNGSCVGMLTELRMMRSHFAKLRRQLQDERQADPKLEVAPRQSV
jgi:hypothetical protein